MNQNTVEHKSLASKREAAIFLNLSLATIDNMIRARKITFSKVGGVVRFRWETLENYVKETEVLSQN